MGELRIVMAVSSDGFLCRGADDDMSWTGPFDKQLFRIVTCQGDGLCAASERTLALMPSKLRGRFLARVVRTVEQKQKETDWTLEELAYRNGGAWLLSGKSLAMEALSRNLVRSVLFMHSCRELGSQGHPNATLHSLMQAMHDQEMGCVQRCTIGGPDNDWVTLETWRRP